MRIEITTLAAFLIAWTTVPLARSLGRAVGAIDQPNSDVRTHTRPTPLLGGVSIALGAALPLLWTGSGPPSPLVLLAFVFVCSMGAYKDISRQDVAPSLQLLVQVVACGLVTTAWRGAPWHDPMRLTIVLGGAALINAVNFLDVMDGLCSTVSAIVAAGIFVLTGQLLALTLSVACCGFWLWNRPKAHIFMGDIGSFFIGSSLFMLVDGETVSGNLHLLIVLAVPAAELLGTIAIRLIRAKALARGDASHPSLCLLNAGLSPWTVLAIYGVATASTCLLSWAIRPDLV
jgi:UDP-N-acetylmuramyl pentapeptide phosphotransferase/UDP-N-acetylglucosamine-1-phosphate transferase